MDEVAALPPSFTPGPPRQPVLEVRVRLPAPMLVEIDALIGSRFVDRSEAIRGLLHDALRGRS